MSGQDTIKMIFGFKVKYLRKQRGLSYQQLAQKTGLSTSYLHDIEKGRKYPKVDKIAALGEAFGVDYDELVSTRASKKLQPVLDLLQSEFLKEFPLELFGISAEKVFELLNNTPDKVNAFVGTLSKITRSYQMQREHLYQAALRSYQDMFDNYFVELEQSVRAFRKEYGMCSKPPVSNALLETLLKEVFGIRIDRTALEGEPPLNRSRSFFASKPKVLMLKAGLQVAQENFLIGRELAFQYLELKPRPYLTRIEEVNSFDKLLNHFKASYWAVALLMDEDSLVEDVRALAALETWQPERFGALLDRYEVTPEMLLQRLTNLLPHHMEARDLFFIRLAGEKDLKHFRMTKELHLSRLHHPYANEANEHYCRRWVSVNIIKRLQAEGRLKGRTIPLVDAQISSYWETPNRYFCLSIAKTDTLFSELPVSVTVGLLINDALKKTFRFLDDPKLPTRLVHTTCERCGITDCEARAAAPVVIEAKRQLEAQQEAMERLNTQG